MEEERHLGCFISKETIERTYIEGRPSRGRISPRDFLDREREKNVKMFSRGRSLCKYLLNISSRHFLKLFSLSPDLCKICVSENFQNVFKRGKHHRDRRPLNNLRKIERLKIFRRY